MSFPPYVAADNHFNRVSCPDQIGRSFDTIPDFVAVKLNEPSSGDSLPFAVLRGKQRFVVHAPSLFDAKNLAGTLLRHPPRYWQDLTVEPDKA